LILKKVVKIVVTGCHILKLNAPNSISAGALDLLARFKGAYSLLLTEWTGGRTGEKGKGGEMDGR